MRDWDIETAQRDLRRIMAELGMSLHARTESSHQVVIHEVLPRIRELKTAEPDRPEPIDPADVKVGDIVEVEADDGSWLVRGEIRKTDEPGTDYPLQIMVDHGDSGALWPSVPGNTVRLVRRAEPEPDPEQVEALVPIIAALDGSDALTELGVEDLARELVRRGVTVRKDT